MCNQKKCSWCGKHTVHIHPRGVMLQLILPIIIEIADIVNSALEEHFPNENVEIIAEPGRFFAASAFTVICRIIGKRDVLRDKEASLKMYYINDGVYGSFNCILYKEEVTVEHLLDENKNLKTFKSVIWGHTCHCADKVCLI
ncbi:ornithine decarboxylase 1-like [Eurosta solidaginis]|uniref:ornithine decarboxylase 1-like n=1 Tax=Eurosta solidaginis TaxID=178769 RepID=UPI003530B527